MGRKLGTLNPAACPAFFAGARPLPEPAAVVALAGNPNCGKTTLFNALTGERRETGNWPGVTVETAFGRSARAVVVDLPGAYDLDGYTQDEAVTRDFLLSGRAGAVLNVVDATRLERNLYLTLRLLEAGLPVVVALNFADKARAGGLRVDREALSRRLGVPVVETVAVTGEGTREALAAAVELAGRRAGTTHRAGTSRRGGPAVTAAGGGSPAAVAAERFEMAANLARECTRGSAAPAEPCWSDRLDRLVTHRYLGVVILLVVMWAVFKFTFALGMPLTGLAGRLVAGAGHLIGSLLQAGGAGNLVRSFVVEGLVAGVGSVLVFLPLVFLLFLALAVLEESGYMARASCVSDRFMRALGLGGKAFIPLVLGFGCNVPAVLAARTLENPRDRLVTILVSPLMSCSGRLPVYTLFAGAFFGARQGLVVLALYGIGVVMAILLARLLTVRLLPGESSDLILELPSYHWPSARGVLRQAWWRGWTFIRKAGTIIAGGVVVMWILGSLPWGVAYASRESLLGRLGAAAAVLLRPAGLGNWETGAALVFGLGAKEFVVAALGLVHGAGEAALPVLLRAHFTPLTALSFMLMALFYSPCLATVAAIRKETGSWKWPALAVGYSLVLGLAAATVTYQVGRLLGMV